MRCVIAPIDLKPGAVWARHTASGDRFWHTLTRVELFDALSCSTPCNGRFSMRDFEHGDAFIEVNKTPPAAECCGMCLAAVAPIASARVLAAALNVGRKVPA